MRPAAPTVTTEGGFSGKRIPLSVDQDNLGHLMDVLTNQYSDPVMTILREYSTNAYDSHVAGGVQAPIEVQLPTPMAPWLIIRDHGIGLSPDDIEHVFSKYAASTKRNDNTQSGYLGLGCKSALSYASQFTFTAVRDGVKSVVAGSRTADRSAVLDLRDPVACDEPNGVEVTISADPGDPFEDRARHLFSFWPRGSVLLNGHIPDRVDERYDGVWINDHICLLSANGPSGRDETHRKAWVVMGNVAYPTQTDSAPPRFRSTFEPTTGSLPPGVVVWMDMDDTDNRIDFTPNREMLSYTARTNEVLDRIRAEIEQSVGAAAQRDVDAVDGHGEALRVAESWRRRAWYVCRDLPLTYRGERIPDLEKIHPGESVFELNNRSSQQFFSAGSLAGHTYQSLAAESMFVSGFRKSRLHTTDRERIRRWVRQHHPNCKHVYLAAERPGRAMHQTVTWRSRPRPSWQSHQPAFVSETRWLDGLTHVDWSEIAAISVSSPKPTASRSSATDAWSVVTDASTRPQSVSTLPDGPKTLISPTQDHLWNVLGPLKLVLADYTIVMLAKNRWNKFCREHDDTVSIDRAMWLSVTDIHRRLTRADKTKIACDNRARLAHLETSRIDDPGMIRIVADLQRPYSDQQLCNRWVAWTQISTRIMMSLSGEDSWPSNHRLKSEADLDHLNQYPLLNAYQPRDHPDHIYEYINALYHWRNCGV